MTRGRPPADPRTSYQIVAPPLDHVLPAPLGAAGRAMADGTTEVSRASVSRSGNWRARDTSIKSSDQNPQELMALHSQRIQVRVIDTRAIPLENLTGMPDAERASLLA